MMMECDELLTLLRKILSENHLSELAVRIIGLSLIDHYRAQERGERIETAAAIDWALKKTKEFELAKEHPDAP